MAFWYNTVLQYEGLILNEISRKVFVKNIENLSCNVGKFKKYQKVSTQVSLRGLRRLT